MVRKPGRPLEPLGGICLRRGQVDLAPLQHRGDRVDSQSFNPSVPRENNFIPVGACRTLAV